MYVSFNDNHVHVWILWQERKFLFSGSLLSRPAQPDQQHDPAQFRHRTDAESYLMRKIHFPSSITRAVFTPLRLVRLFSQLTETAETNKRTVIIICAAEYQVRICYFQKWWISHVPVIFLTKLRTTGVERLRQRRRMRNTVDSRWIVKVVLVKYTFIEFCVFFLQGYSMKFKGSELLVENEKGK